MRVSINVSTLLEKPMTEGQIGLLKRAYWPDRADKPVDRFLLFAAIRSARDDNFAVALSGAWLRVLRARAHRRGGKASECRKSQR